MQYANHCLPTFYENMLGVYMEKEIRKMIEDYLEALNEHPFAMNYRNFYQEGKVDATKYILEEIEEIFNKWKKK